MIKIKLKMLKIRLYLAVFFFSVILFPSSGQSVTVLEKYGTILKNYSGYYIARTDTNNIYIVKLTFQVTFILQRIFFENNELTEGDKIVLDKMTNFGNVYYVFTEKGVECIDRKTNTISISDKNYILYNPNRHSRSPNGDIIFNINYIIADKYVRWLPFNSSNSYFAESPDEVIDIVNNKLFSPTDEQRRLTGKFIFSEYEIIKIENMEIPFTDEEIKNDEIIVETNRQFIFGRHISAYHDNWCLAGVLGRWDNGRYKFGGVHIDGIGYANEIFYYFVDYDTIIYEHHLIELINSDEKKYKNIKYKIIFKREIISE
jgi:hypothetical protein